MIPMKDIVNTVLIGEDLAENARLSLEAVSIGESRCVRKHPFPTVTFCEGLQKDKHPA